MNELELGCFGIVITYENDDRESAKIKSDMKELPEDLDTKALNAAVEIIEEMILEHFIAGIDVSTPEYIVGIESAFNKASSNF